MSEMLKPKLIVAVCVAALLGSSIQNEGITKGPQGCPRDAAAWSCNRKDTCKVVSEHSHNQVAVIV